MGPIQYVMVLVEGIVEEANDDDVENPEQLALVLIKANGL